MHILLLVLHENATLLHSQLDATSMHKIFVFLSRRMPFWKGFAPHDAAAEGRR
jgi:hypothetical protein